MQWEDSVEFTPALVTETYSVTFAAMLYKLLQYKTTEFNGPTIQ